LDYHVPNDWRSSALSRKRSEGAGCILSAKEEDCNRVGEFNFPSHTTVRTHRIRRFLSTF
jgi:hypothetical protein